MSDETPDDVARDAIKSLLGDQPGWRDDERWWLGAVHIINSLLLGREKTAKELRDAYSHIGNLRRTIENGVSQSLAEQVERGEVPLPVISLKRWRQSIRDEAARRAAKGSLHKGELAREAGISESTLHRILRQKKRGEAE